MLVSPILPHAHINGEGRLAVVQVEFGARPPVSRAEIVPGDPITPYPFALGVTPYDISPDGQRILLRQREGSEAYSQLTVLRDWVAMLEERE